MTAKKERELQLVEPVAPVELKEEETKEKDRPSRNYWLDPHRNQSAVRIFTQLTRRAEYIQRLPKRSYTKNEVIALLQEMRDGLCA